MLESVVGFFLAAVERLLMKKWQRALPSPQHIVEVRDKDSPIAHWMNRFNHAGAGAASPGL